MGKLRQQTKESLMYIGILGTGVVGQTLSAKLVELGHEIVVGTRDVGNTLANTQPNAHGQPSYGVWQREHPAVRLGLFADAARHGEVVINATNGAGSLAALRLAGEPNLKNKILIDVSNPLDGSQGMPPILSICNTDSLGEQIQRAFPAARVVKTLNTVSAPVMINPGQVAGGDHTLFISGNEAAAKAQVAAWLKNWFGWRDVVDLGDITSARGAEMYLPLWLRLWSALGTGMLNVKIVR
jgi:8-hydroxy-5-deazaflavin:NADPH oxidoreductase